MLRYYLVFASLSALLSTPQVGAAEGFRLAVLADKEGKLFCNAWQVRTRVGSYLVSAAHCREAAEQMEGGAEAFFPGESEPLQRAEIGKVVFAGDPDQRAAPDIALWQATGGMRESALADVWVATAGAVVEEAVEVHYFAGDGVGESVTRRWQRQKRTCVAKRQVGSVRVASVTRVDWVSSFAISVVPDDADAAVAPQLFYLDKCDRPLPRGSSGGAIVGKQGKIIGVVSSGVTTHHFLEGWRNGGWKDLFWKDRSEHTSENLRAHFIASDGKAYGPLPHATVFGDGNAKPLFLFGAGAAIPEEYTQ